jgi:5'-3' exonuclease
MNRTLLIDASYLMKRSMYGNTNLYNEYGHVGGLYTFLTSVRMLLKELNPKKVILAWDGENSGKLRYDKYKGYKANRDSKKWHTKIVMTESEINYQDKFKESELWQRVRVQEYAEDLFLRQIEIPEIEGDDLIAYYCKVYHKEEDIIIYSNDRDYFQLVDYDNVSFYMADQKHIVDKFNSLMFFEYHYENACLVKTICGDNSDNIKGIEGVQLPTLLKYFPELAKKKISIGYIISKAKEIQEERIKLKKKPLKNIDAIIGGREIYKMNEFLVDLKNPLMTSEAKEELKIISEGILNPADRTSKNLLRLMNEDKFFIIYNGDFVQYVTPFFGVIQEEKKYFENNRN